MWLRIFNVGHGACVLLVADIGTAVLFDCGHDDEIGFRPSFALSRGGVSRLGYFVVMNYDEDHISDLVDLQRLLSIQVIVRNPSISVDELRRLKRQGGALGNNMSALLAMLGAYGSPVFAWPDLGRVRLTYYHTLYPTFTDTNNLSMVMFIECDGLEMILPGDLETAGWRVLLQDASFRDHLSRVRVFVASHHGRESGYCQDVFNYCRPDIVVISDEAVRYDTQEHCYEEHASGVAWHTGVTRKVLTTRSDGNITVTKNVGEGFRIATEYQKTPLASLLEALQRRQAMSAAAPLFQLLQRS